LHYVKFNIGVGIDRISLSFQGDYSRFAPDFNYCRLLHRRGGHMQLLDLLLDLPARSTTTGESLVAAAFADPMKPLA
jgi:hypothetical protein